MATDKPREQHHTAALAHGTEATARAAGETVRRAMRTQMTVEQRLEANQQKRDELKAKTKKADGYAYYLIHTPFYRQGAHYPAESVVRIPQDEDPSINWEAVGEQATPGEPPVTTAGQMNNPVRLPAVPAKSEPYKKDETSGVTDPPGKETTKDVPGGKRPSDKSL